MNLINQDTIDLIKSFEGLKLEAYSDAVNVATIGYGTTIYPPYHEKGRKVKLGDKITREQAEDFLRYDVTNKSKRVTGMVTKTLTDNQFGALTSFAYNLGEGALKSSTLLKKVNKDPNDPSIESEFMKWINAGGKPLNGLIRRRKAEYNLYKS